MTFSFAEGAKVSKLGLRGKVHSTLFIIPKHHQLAQKSQEEVVGYMGHP